MPKSSITNSSSYDKLPGLLLTDTQDRNQVIYAGLFRHMPADVSELLETVLFDFRPFAHINGLDSQLEDPTDWTMVARSDFMTAVGKLHNTAGATIEESVAPSRSTLFLRRVVGVGPNVVFVRRRKSD